MNDLITTVLDLFALVLLALAVGAALVAWVGWAGVAGPAVVLFAGARVIDWRMARR